MNADNALASTRAIPRQMVAGILFILAAIATTAGLVVSLQPKHAAAPVTRTMSTADLIAPVSRVEIGTAAAGAASAAETPAAAATTPAAAPTPAAAAPTANATAPAPASAAASPAAAPTPAAAAAGKTGEQVYQATCSACHGTGVAGAPKLGDKGAWAPRIAQGLATLTKNAITGKAAMPPKGGNGALSEAEVGRAVIHMANQSGGSFKEAASAAPTATAPTAAPTAAAAAASTPVAAPEPVDPEVARRKALGKAVYQKTCSNCHAKGVSGAPKLGDIKAWGPRIATGAEALLASVLNGKGAMPPKGGNAKLSEAEVRAGLEYMLGQFK